MHNVKVRKLFTLILLEFYRFNSGQALDCSGHPLLLFLYLDSVIKSASARNTVHHSKVAKILKPLVLALSTPQARTSTMRNFSLR
jgi:hypothetical protein